MLSQPQIWLNRYFTSSHPSNSSPQNEQSQARQDPTTSASYHCTNPASEGGPCAEAVAGKGEWKGRMDGAEGWGGDEGDVGGGVIFFFFLFLKKVFLSRETAAQTILEEVGKEGAREPRQRLWVPRTDRRPQLEQLRAERGSGCCGRDQGIATAASGAGAAAFPVGAAGVPTGVGRPPGLELQPRRLLRLRRAEGRGRDGVRGCPGTSTAGAGPPLPDSFLAWGSWCRAPRQMLGGRWQLPEPAGDGAAGFQPRSLAEGTG